MKGRRHTPEQIVRKLREADRLLAEGADIPSVCRHLEISVPTYQRWRMHPHADLFSKCGSNAKIRPTRWPDPRVQTRCLRQPDGILGTYRSHP